MIGGRRRGLQSAGVSEAGAVVAEGAAANDKAKGKKISLLASSNV